MEKINIRGVFFDNVTLDEAVSVAEGYIERGGQCVVFTPNAEIVQMAVENAEFCKIVNSADLIIPDGAGVVLASKILKKRLKGKADKQKRAVTNFCDSPFAYSFLSFA